MKYLCMYCSVFVFDNEKGDKNAGLVPGIKIENIPETWKCPVCGQPKSYLTEIGEEEFNKKKPNYDKLNAPVEEKKDILYYRDIARKRLSGMCAVNKVCDGNPDRMCMGMKYGRAIGFGGAGQGRTFDANFKALEKYKFRMRVVKRHAEPQFEAKFLSNKIKMPVMVSSISGAKLSMNDAISESDFQRGMIEGAKLFGTIGLSGNTVDFPEHPGIDVIKENNGWGIPVFKPQEQRALLKLFSMAEKANVIAIGVDLDGCGSTNWALRGKPVYRKSEKELKELVDATDRPVIFKGIMTMEDAEKVVDSGAAALDVSNHGGRVLDYGQGVAEVLPEISRKYRDKILIMADGAVRTGYDALKLLALGADIALIGRPLARMSLAGGAEAVKAYLDYVKADLRGAMLMTGCDNLKEVDHKILVKAD